MLRGVTEISDHSTEPFAVKGLGWKVFLECAQFPIRRIGLKTCSRVLISLNKNLQKIFLKKINKNKTFRRMRLRRKTKAFIPCRKLLSSRSWCNLTCLMRNIAKYFRKMSASCCGRMFQFVSLFFCVLNFRTSRFKVLS